MRDRLFFIAGSATKIALAGAQEFLEAFRLADGIGLHQKLHLGGGAHLVDAVDLAVEFGDHVREFLAVVGHTQALAHVLEQVNAAFFMSDVARQHVLRRGALAEIVRQRGKAHGQRIALRGGVIDHHHDVHAGIDLRMVLRRLRHAPQAVEFRHDALQRTTLAQHFEHA